MSHHICNVAGCTKVLSKDLLMCPIHWRLVPKPIQLKVWRNYKVGQTIATATDEWKAAAKEATQVATQEAARKADRRKEFLQNRFGSAK